jgi:hypothetical protein
LLPKKYLNDNIGLNQILKQPQGLPITMAKSLDLAKGPAIIWPKNHFFSQIFAFSQLWYGVCFKQWHQQVFQVSGVSSSPLFLSFLTPET